MWSWEVTTTLLQSLSSAILNALGVCCLESPCQTPLPDPEWVCPPSSRYGLSYLPSLPTPTSSPPSSLLLSPSANPIVLGAPKRPPSVWLSTCFLRVWPSLLTELKAEQCLIVACSVPPRSSVQMHHTMNKAIPLEQWMEASRRDVGDAEGPWTQNMPLWLQRFSYPQYVQDK